MSDHPSHHKKQKLNTDTDDNDDEERSGEHVETGNDVCDTVPIAITAPTSAVTALALLSDTIIFSGHRDGCICRWNLTTNAQSSEDPQQQQQQLQQQNPNRQLPDWVITSACVNLTNHEIYGKEEKLGIAGLVVRRNQESHINRSCRETATTSVSSTTRIAAVATHFLYSWNHQREDMRIEINGIPQKVMIWNATTSERLSALMIDVGRCCHTKMYANPLISCLVFCKLLVNENSNITSKSEPSTIVKVWTDAVIVALQATCEVPTQNSDDCMPSDTADVGVKIAASPLPVSPPPKRTTAIPTGNIVPFYEQTRKRMPPWTAVGGFVRALAVVNPTATSTVIDNQNSSYDGYIVSVTETTRNPIVAQEQQQRENSGTDSTTAPSNEEEKEEVTNTPSNESGQTNSIILWDTASPGTMLHIFSLNDVSDSRNCLYPQCFNGSIYALTLSHCNQYLLLSMFMELSNNNRHVVLRVPSKTEESSSNRPVDNSNILSVCGWYSSSEREIAASTRGDLIVSTSIQSTVNENIMQHDSTLYSFRDLLDSIELVKSNNLEIDVTKLLSTTQMRILAESATAIKPTSIALGQSYVFIGYENGCTSSNIIPSSMKLAVNNWNSNNESNEYVSCSKAPIGLRGVPCPHLSDTANNVNLQNKCIII